MSQHSTRRTPSLTTTLWLTAGAAACVVVGVVLADRFGGGRKLVARFTSLFRADDGDRDDEFADDSEGDEFEPDDTEDDEVGSDDYEYDDAGLDASDAAAADDADNAGAPPIDERVLAAFEQDPVLSQRAIEIDEPEPATIVLAGRVPSAEDAAHAVTIARGVPGVAHVESRLRVRSARART